jgi:aquaporin Z
MKAYIAEVFGTFCLVFIGCAAVVTGGLGGLLPASSLGIGLSFGIAVVAMAYAIGPVSGAHLNPAVSLGAFFAGRLPASDLIGYIVAQVIGGIIGAVVLYIIASGFSTGAPANLAANGWDPVAGYSTTAALITEIVATFIFVTVILGVTNAKHTTVFAGLVIGLTLAALHVCFIPVSGNSLNPARSIGPALFSGGAAIGQLWLYIVAPLIGGAIAGIVAKAGIFEKD